MIKLLMKVVAALSVILVLWVSNTSIQSSLKRMYRIVPAGEPTPVEKIRLLIKKRYNEEKAIRKNIKYWPNKMAINSPEKQKTILFYNKFWFWPDFGIGEGSAIFQEMGCPISNCFATHNRSLVKPEEADAIIWHALGDKSLPGVRSQHTRLVFYLTEPTPRVNTKNLENLRYNNVFNYTMTLSRSADIFDPYGIISKMDQPIPLKTAKSFVIGKTKMAVWFASHCTTQSKRENVVKEIQKYFKVDIYGKCGELRCKKNPLNQNDENCLKSVEKDYKFYFAFENSLCKDYISEKFFDAMKLDIIPVVYGIGDYEEVAPPHSYINILSFENMKAAVDHLIYLSNNDTAYNEYFWWKGHYKALTHFVQKKSPEYRDISWCSLCKKLHTDTQAKSYKHIQPFATLKNCFSPSHPIIKDLFR